MIPKMSPLPGYRDRANGAGKLRRGVTYYSLVSANTKVGGPNKAHTLGKNAYKIQFHKD